MPVYSMKYLQIAIYGIVSQVYHEKPRPPYLILELPILYYPSDSYYCFQFD